MEEQTNEFAIDTREVYCQLRNKYDDFSVKLLIEFRDRLEDILIKYERVSSEFHPLNWRNFRHEYLQWSNERWRTTEEKNKFQVFNLYYFMHDNVRKKRISINSLTNDEKIQIVAPFRADTSDQEQRPSIPLSRANSKDVSQDLSPLQNQLLIEIKRDNDFELSKTLESHKTLIFEDLSEEDRKEILDKLCPPVIPISPDDLNGLGGMSGGNRKLINRYNDNDPYDWWRWEYDIYTLDMSCELTIDSDREDFEYFFAWQLALTDYFKIESFLQEQFEHTFLGEVEIFKKFIKILFRTYKYILTDSDNKEIVFEYIDNLKEIEKVIIDIEKTEDIENEGTIIIDLPKFPRAKFRTKNDDLTCLTRYRTALLVDTLRQVKVFLSEDFQPNIHVAKAIQVLTGYSHNKLRTDLTAVHEKEDLIATQEILQKAIDLITKQLKNK